MACANSRWLMQRSLRAIRILLPISLNFMTISPSMIISILYMCGGGQKVTSFLIKIVKMQKITDADASVINMLN